MMKTVCEQNQCTGCSACIGKCPKNAIRIDDCIMAYNAVIDESLCINCGMCEKICPQNHPIEKRSPTIWRQGWALDENIRGLASSGGIATAMAVGFVKNGGVVCSCVFEKGNFIFDFARTEDEVRKFSGSKYVKSDPTGIYPKIKKILQCGTKVLFIGLPCQSAAIQSFTNRHDLLYTVDLICHGTPSPKTLQMFLTEKGYHIEAMNDIKFRQKTRFFLSEGSESIEPPSVRDKYTYAFLMSLCYTENCYSCQYAKTERVSDITLGDSWGSELAEEEKGKGISLVLCQTAKGNELLGMSELHLEDVDTEKALANNHQLYIPSAKPSGYALFYSTLFKKKNFSMAVKKCYPVVFLKQSVKSLLIRVGIVGGNKYAK